MEKKILKKKNEVFIVKQVKIMPTDIQTNCQKDKQGIDFFLLYLRKEILINY